MPSLGRRVLTESHLGLTQKVLEVTHDWWVESFRYSPVQCNDACPELINSGFHLGFPGRECESLTEVDHLIHSVMSAEKCPASALYVSEVDRGIQRGPDCLELVLECSQFSRGVNSRWGSGLRSHALPHRI
jgi:hypothetical protein